MDATGFNDSGSATSALATASSANHCAAVDAASMLWGKQHLQRDRAFLLIFHHELVRTSGFSLCLDCPRSRSKLLDPLHIRPHVLGVANGGFSDRGVFAMREAKPGGLQTGGFPTFFRKGPDCVTDLWGLFLVGAVNRPRKRKRTKSGKSPDHPRTNRENPRKSGKSQKGHKRKDRSRSGNPPV